MEILDVRGLLTTSGEYSRRSGAPTAIVVHHSATSPALTPLAIAAYHVYTRDYKGIAYHYCVGPDGTVWQCNDDAAISWHAGCAAVHGPNCPLNANAYSLGVCLVGNFMETGPPPAQLAAARELVAHLRAQYGYLTIIGHREAHGARTECPGDTWPEWKGELEGGSVNSIIGWHLGNERPMTAIDWRILETVPPRCIVFLPDQGIPPKGEDKLDGIERVLAIAPGCHIIMRPYYTPQEPTVAALQAYIDQCKRAVDRYRDAIPAGQRHLQIWNEQNMPRWAQWEGFGDQLADMQRFDDWFCAAYSQLKRHDPSWLIGWTPLTPGNRDVWFPGDPQGHYYMHGPAGCVENPSATQIARGIAEGPCKASLMLADEYYAHVYIHETRTAYREPWLGLRFERYRQFLPKPMTLWITEAGYPSRATWPTWGDDALIDWLNTIATRSVAGIALWILGDKEQWGMPWYHYGEPRPLVGRLRDWQAQYITPDIPEPPAPQPPQEEPVTTLSADVAATAWRWHCEEATRELERGEHTQALARLKALVDRSKGLAYRVEDTVDAIVETLARV